MVETDADLVFVLLRHFRDKISVQNWIKWEKNLSFLQAWSLLLNFLAETHFYEQVVKI